MGQGKQRRQDSLRREKGEGCEMKEEEGDIGTVMGGCAGFIVSREVRWARSGVWENAAKPGGEGRDTEIIKKN
jgi:hypothetical protein